MNIRRSFIVVSGAAMLFGATTAPLLAGAEQPTLGTTTTTTSVGRRVRAAAGIHLPRRRHQPHHGRRPGDLDGPRHRADHGRRHARAVDRCGDRPRRLGDLVRCPRRAVLRVSVHRRSAAAARSLRCLRRVHRDHRRAVRRRRVHRVVVAVDGMRHDGSVGMARHRRQPRRPFVHGRRGGAAHRAAGPRGVRRRAADVQRDAVGDLAGDGLGSAADDHTSADDGPDRLDGIAHHGTSPPRRRCHGTVTTAPASTTPAPTTTAFPAVGVRLVDATNFLTVTVPADWIDQDLDPSTRDDGGDRPSIVASPDLAAVLRLVRRIGGLPAGASRHHRAGRPAGAPRLPESLHRRRRHRRRRCPLQRTAPDLAELRRVGSRGRQHRRPFSGQLVHDVPAGAPGRPPTTRCSTRSWRRPVPFPGEVYPKASPAAPLTPTGPVPPELLVAPDIAADRRRRQPGPPVGRRAEHLDRHRQLPEHERRRQRPADRQGRPSARRVLLDEWGAPGVQVVAYPFTADPSTLLRNLGFADQCTDAGVQSLSDGTFTGLMQTWTECGDTTSRDVQLALSPADQSVTVYIEIQLSDSGQHPAAGRVVVATGRMIANSARRSRQSVSAPSPSSPWRRRCRVHHPARRPRQPPKRSRRAPTPSTSSSYRPATRCSSTTPNRLTVAVPDTWTDIDTTPDVANGARGPTDRRRCRRRGRRGRSSHPVCCTPPFPYTSRRGGAVPRASWRRRQDAPINEVVPTTTARSSAAGGDPPGAARAARANSTSSSPARPARPSPWPSSSGSVEPEDVLRRRGPAVVQLHADGDLAGQPTSRHVTSTSTTTTSLPDDGSSSVPEPTDRVVNNTGLIAVDVPQSWNEVDTTGGLNDDGSYRPTHSRRTAARRVQRRLRRARRTRHRPPAGGRRGQHPGQSPEARPTAPRAGPHPFDNGQLTGLSRDVDRLRRGHDGRACWSSPVRRTARSPSTPGSRTRPATGVSPADRRLAGARRARRRTRRRRHRHRRRRRLGTVPESLWQGPVDEQTVLVIDRTRQLRIEVPSAWQRHPALAVVQRRRQPATAHRCLTPHRHDDCPVGRTGSDLQRVPVHRPGDVARQPPAGTGGCDGRWRASRSTTASTEAAAHLDRTATARQTRFVTLVVSPPDNSSTLVHRGSAADSGRHRAAASVLSSFGQL